MNTVLREENFTDLIIGEDLALLKGAPGGPILAPAPAALGADLEMIRAKLTDKQSNETLLHDGVQYRVAFMHTVRGKFAVLRRAMEALPPLSKLGLPEYICNRLVSPVLNQGLVIFCGGMGSGKTTSASSCVSERLKSHGGLAVTLEDPPELPLHGPHGGGMCFQRHIPRSAFREGMVETLRLAAPEIIFLGEIRDSPEASEALKACVNGHLVVTTMHGAGIPEALHRLVVLAQEVSGKAAAELLADGLACVVYQKLEIARQKRFLSAEALLPGEAEKGCPVRSLIRTESFHKLTGEINRQFNLYMRDLHMQVGRRGG